MYQSSAVNAQTVSIDKFKETWMRKQDTDRDTSLRMPLDEKQYQQDKQYGVTVDLADVPAMAETHSWKVIPNTYPYNMVLKDHVLIVTKEGVGDWSELTQGAKEEYEQLIRPILLESYDIIFENAPHRRSVPGIYHWHAANIEVNRDICLGIEE